ncbi:hypothetical protein ElyMa_004852500 [Elysia marginata]|uniref:Uncharacterized protein n=1 Tax=Elysia marginata TaxID=1093978 RepID=A0AAV4IQF0_9GAST|nr:hypothetical protein ElyMa_004852500 [Elysia marginata]
MSSAIYQTISTLVIVLVALSGNSQHHQCQQNWGPPNTHYDPDSGDLQLELNQPTLSFPSREDCQAAMCVPKSGKPVPARGDGRSKLVCQLVNSATNQENSSVVVDGQSTNTSLPSEVFTELKDLLQSLSPDAEILRDNNGSIIGAQDASAVDRAPPLSTRELPPVEARGRSLPSNDDASVCCSTVEKYFFNTTLVDYFGNTQTLAQINEVGVYQLIRHGFCG